MLAPGGRRMSTMLDGRRILKHRMCRISERRERVMLNLVGHVKSELEGLPILKLVALALPISDRAFSKYPAHTSSSIGGKLSTKDGGGKSSMRNTRLI